MTTHTSTPAGSMSAARTALGPGYQVALTERLANLALTTVKRHANHR